ncbi:MAG TPA: GNAT family N-acetyltransferase [Ilumatobacteraceae bacterium]|nr:GNAT family N-acetyltransferase [Ilumatobacteraceae bacterium]
MSASTSRTNTRPRDVATRPQPHVGWAADGPVRHWGIWSDDQLVGGVELRMRDDGRANLSYLVFPAARRRGLATRAAQMASTWAFETLGVSAVVAIIDEQNVASRQVAERAGFVLDGRAEPWEYSETGIMLCYLLDGRTLSGLSASGMTQ